MDYEQASDMLASVTTTAMQKQSAFIQFHDLVIRSARQSKESKQAQATRAQLAAGAAKNARKPSKPSQLDVGAAKAQKKLQKGAAQKKDAEPKALDHKSPLTSGNRVSAQPAPAAQETTKEARGAGCYTRTPGGRKNPKRGKTMTKAYALGRAFGCGAIEKEAIHGSLARLLRRLIAPSPAPSPAPAPVPVPAGPPHYKSPSRWPRRALKMPGLSQLSKAVAPGLFR